MDNLLDVRGRVCEKVHQGIFYRDRNRVSGLIATAKPYRIKAAHRRRRKVASGPNVYQHTDALGSPVAVTNQAGAVIERMQYEPYGKVINGAPKDGPGYTGHVLDAATGLNYMQQRYYWSEGGIFLSVDPVSVDTTTGWNFCRYCYAFNNPYKFTDPDGRQQMPIFVMPHGLPRDPKNLLNQPARTEGRSSHQMAHELDDVSTVAGVAAIALVEIPPAAIVAEGISLTAAAGALMLEPTPKRGLNLLTGGALNIGAKLAKGSEAAENTVKLLDGADTTDDVGETIIEHTEPEPARDPPPKPENADQNNRRENL